MVTIQEQIALAPRTTMGLGGPARFYIECGSIEEILEALRSAREKQIPVHILGGGSNTVFADEGFPGMVIAVRLQGVQWGQDGVVEAAAGEVWDQFVQASLERGLAGLECLSGIPGLVGATPMQNVGAYGQDVSEVIETVTAIERATGKLVTFANKDCAFGYRTSAFKTSRADQYIITSVRFRLRTDGQPVVRYPQLQQSVGDTPTLAQVRDEVLKLRRSKSMVVDPNDPNTRSCGSFFTNPIVTKEHLVTLQVAYPNIPFFTGEETPRLTAAADWTAHSVKIPAAWLVEQAGFDKGFTRDGVGISTNHPLALINIHGTSRALLQLASDIQKAVLEKFKIPLVQEPVAIPGAITVQ